ncbi:helix-turn-helix domain-containing protein [Micrococcus antarcticus]|uniref:helix-turn-helix domain-containing protein n=1 Tax=Micrococcus antarcticus TaxID=86171 RepID=UPI00384CEA22
MTAVTLHAPAAEPADLIDYREAAQLLNKAPSTVYQYVADGTLAAYDRCREGRQRPSLHFSRAEVEAYVALRRGETAVPRHLADLSEADREVARGFGRRAAAAAPALSEAAATEAAAAFAAALKGGAL